MTQIFRALSGVFAPSVCASSQRRIRATAFCMRRLVQLLIPAAAALPFVGVTYAGVVVVLPSGQETSCGTPSDPVVYGFPCGESHLGPGLGTIPGIPGVVEQRAAAEFLVAGISEVRNATLVLTSTGWSPYPGLQGEPVIEFRGYQGDGPISAIDVSAGTYLFAASFPVRLATYSFDVTTFVSEAIDQGWTHAGFSLRDVAFGSAISFSPRHSGNGNYLQIEAESIPPPPIPEPPRHALMVAGLAVLGLAAVRRQAVVA